MPPDEARKGCADCREYTAREAGVMNAIYADCTITCERMPRCAVCQDIKKPIGRSAPLGTIYCSSHCKGYREEPTPGHLWPGELADIRGEEDNHAAG